MIFGTCPELSLLHLATLVCSWCLPISGLVKLTGMKTAAKGRRIAGFARGFVSQ
jgi:hypothetical protein